MATGFAQNGAKVYIAARKEHQLKEVRFSCKKKDNFQTCPPVPFLLQAVADINKIATGPKAEYIVGNVGVSVFLSSLMIFLNRFYMKVKSGL